MEPVDERRVEPADERGCVAGGLHDGHRPPHVVVLLLPAHVVEGAEAGVASVSVALAQVRTSLRRHANQGLPVRPIRFISATDCRSCSAASLAISAQSSLTIAADQ